jgi:plastocyanin
VPSPSPSPQTIVDTLLGVAAVFVTPDWKALIALIPIGLALLFLAWTLLTLRKFATLGPTRRAPARLQPVTPPTVHMPGGSAAPIVVAFGAGALFLGLVLGGVWLWIGVALLVVTLVVWFREALRDYDHLAGAQRLPAVVHEGPPPGVHMPGPSIRPLLGALGSAALLGGLVIGGWVLILAVVFLVYTLIGWLVDATAEYRKVEEADTTGHLENIPTRRLPVRTLQAFAVLFALVGMSQLGIFPPAGPGSGGVPGASAAPSGAVAPAGALTVVAKGLAFDTHELEVKAGAPFTIFLDNKDPSTTPHDVEIRTTDGAKVQGQPKTDGGKSQAYEYDALQPGSYVFICSIHPIDAMKGTLTVK